MKTFFDSIFIGGSNEFRDLDYPIKLEYYKTIKTEENVKAKYGIEIVVTEFINGKVNIESKTIDDIAETSEEIDKIIKILKDNEVTPIGIEDAIVEIT
ncbi:MAG: hypothetical protein IJK18_05140 [Clostridia bacterium]|nr:hypothetical protein [Clostridia bacterium]